MNILELLKTAILNQPDKGKDDTIPAMLSPGEYVIPAQDVALLGDGNNEAGAGVLDMLLQLIRGLHKDGTSN